MNVDVTTFKLQDLETKYLSAQNEYFIKGPFITGSKFSGFCLDMYLGCGVGLSSILEERTLFLVELMTSRTRRNF